MITVPPYLQNGDTIGMVCPAGFMPFEKAQTCINSLQNWGYKVKVGKTVGNRYNYFSGTDKERLSDVQQMLDDTDIKAILCARGGYGLSRIIDEIDFTLFRQHPKWIIGYSDITVLHAHLFSTLKIASLHAPMAAAFNDGGFNNEYVQSLQKALCGEQLMYNCEPNQLNKTGFAQGYLLGGNLALLAHIVGSASDINTTGAILFIEDVGEYIYNIDRMLLQLKRAGKLSHLAGLVVGSFTEMKDTVIPFGETVYNVIFDKVKDYHYPLCFNFPVGHTDKNYCLKHGVQHKLHIDNNKLLLEEIK